MLTFGNRRTNVLQGTVHLGLFLAYLLLIFIPWQRWLSGPSAARVVRSDTRHSRNLCSGSLRLHGLLWVHRDVSCHPCFRRLPICLSTHASPDPVTTERRLLPALMW